MADRAIFVCTLVLAAVYLYAAEQLPALEIGDPLGPKAFPRLLGAGLVLAAVLLFFEMKKARKAAPVSATPPTAAERGGMLVTAAAVGWTLLYFLVFEPLGYAVATTLYLIPLTAYFNRGKWVANGLTSVLFAVLTYLLFTKLLGVNLPAGVLHF